MGWIGRVEPSALEVLCSECDGNQQVYRPHVPTEAKTYGDDWVECPTCSGRGTTPNLLGEAVLDLVRKHYPQLEDPMREQLRELEGELKTYTERANGEDGKDGESNGR